LAHNPLAEAEKELAALEQTLVKSALGGDRETYSAILAPDWTVTDVAGRVQTKTQVVEGLFSGEPPMADGKIDDVRVRLFGETAVVTGRTTATARNGSQVTLRFTDVFVRQGERWLAVASQGTQVA
jgi:hypothetical protein